MVARIATAFALVTAVSACRMTPQEIQVIETENQLLREQVQRMREECDVYRDVTLELDEGEAADEAP